MRVHTGVAIILFAIGLSIGWKVHAFQDCRKVGHALLYCVVEH